MGFLNLSKTTKILIVLFLIVLAIAFWWDYLVPHSTPCETAEDCFPKNASEARVGVAYECVNKTCVEKPFGNPASMKCEEDGGTLRMEGVEEGTRGICVLPSGVECEEWEYFNGECP